jgi:hypothetical protein
MLCMAIHLQEPADAVTYISRYVVILRTVVAPTRKLVTNST